MKIIKSISPNESDEFNNKSLFSNSMNGFGKHFGNVGESRFDTFSLQSSQIFPTGTVQMFGVVFTGCPQTNIIIGEHIFRFITGISGISHDFTACGKIQQYLSDSLMVMRISGCESIFCRNTAGSYRYMYFEAMETSTFGSIAATIFPACDDTASGNANVMANSCRKTVNTVDFMTIENENGGKYAVQVIYINEGNPHIETIPAINISIYNQTELQIDNTGEGILIWQVTECPEWLQFNFETFYSPYIQWNNEMPAGMMPQGSIPLFFNLVFFENISENLTGKIVIASNDKTNPQKTIQVNVDLGDPRIDVYLYDKTLDFGKTETSINLGFSCWNNGILLWEFTDLPEWLTCSPIKGGLTNYGWQDVTFTVDRNRVPEGALSTTIYLNSNDATNPNVPITVKIRNYTKNPAGIVGIDGNVTDARLDKSNGKLYYTTAQPNKFVEFDIVSRTVTRDLELKKAPSCFSISDNGQEVAIGQAGQFSIVDLNSFTLTKALDAYYPINDIAWVTDDVVTYTPAGDIQSGDLYWVDIRTNTHTGTDFRISYGSLIKKIPGHNYVLYTNLNLFPGGISVIDIQTKNTQYYTHSSIGNFWFSQNGKYLFCSEAGRIYRVSDLVSRPDISPIATFQTDYSYRPIWIDDNTATNSVWSLKNAGIIDQYEATDFNCVKSLNYTDYYIKNGTEYDAEGKFLFANQAGTELVVLRNATGNQAAWSLEFVPVR